MQSSMLQSLLKQEVPGQGRKTGHRHHQTANQHNVQHASANLPLFLQHEPTDSAAETHDRVSTFGAASTLPRYLQSEQCLRSELTSAGNGKPLDAKTRERFGESLHTDLSQVRLHADHRAHQLAVSLGAVAFTNGNHIYFRSGKYSPQSQAGARLLAHETFHTVQQTSRAESQATTASGFNVSKADEPLEQQADSMADTMTARQRVTHAGGRGDDRSYRRATGFSAQANADSSVKTGRSSLIQRQEVPEAKSTGLQSWLHGLNSRNEIEARDYEITNAERFGTSKEHLERTRKYRQDLYNTLPPEYKDRVDRGVYVVPPEDLENEDVTPPIAR